MRRDVTDSFVSYALTTINGRYGALPAWCVEDEDSATLGRDLFDEAGYYQPNGSYFLTPIGHALCDRRVAEEQARTNPAAEAAVRSHREAAA